MAYDSLQRKADLQEARRFKEFLPDKKKDGDWVIQERRRKKEEAMWGEQEALLRRAWG